MNNIELPFERGSMEDVNVAIMSGTQDTSGETSQSQESINVADDRDTNIKLDYSKLPERLKRVRILLVKQFCFPFTFFNNLLVH